MATRKRDKGKSKNDRKPKRLFRQGRVSVVSPGIKIVHEPEGHERMSDALDDLIEPYCEHAESEDAYRSLLFLGMLAWNASLLPEDRGQAMINKTLNERMTRASDEQRSNARQFVEALVKRKNEHFAANRREIISFQLIHTSDGYDLTVAATL